MPLLPITLPPSIGKFAGFLSSGVVGAMLGRFARVTDRPRQSADGDGQRPGLQGVDSAKASLATEVVPMSPAVLRRMRTGRLRLPPEVAEATSQQEPALGAVNAFADRLADLSGWAWIAVGRTLMKDPSAYAMRATPYAILEATINDRGLAVAAWYVRDAIETSAFYASQTMARWTPSDRRAFAAAHAAAEEAALALLAREFLPATDRDALCAPFESFVREALAPG